MEPLLWSLLSAVLTYVMAGQSSSLPYMPQTPETCIENTMEYYVGSLCCNKCLPGTRLLRKCSVKENTVCEECPSDRFSDSFNYYPKCFSCSKCDDEKGLRYERQCSKDSNAICVCKPGWFCLLRDNPQSCSECQEYRKCPPGKGAKSQGTPDSDIKCMNCPEGTFSSEPSSQPCKSHTRCESQGRSVLHPGTTKSDTVCGDPVAATSNPAIIHRLQTTVQTVPEPSTLREASTTPALHAPNLTTEIFWTSSTAPIMQSSRTPESTITPVWIGFLAVSILVILGLLMITFWICHRKGTYKPALDDVSEKGHGSGMPQSLDSIEFQRLLTDSKTDPSTSSSTDSQSTGVSQDCIHMEQPSVSSPCVNVSITATIKCHVNPATGTCSIPISSCQQQPEPDLPLSQEEELCKTCEQEDGKSALHSVQESGMTVC